MRICNGASERHAGRGKKGGRGSEERGRKIEDRGTQAAENAWKDGGDKLGMVRTFGGKGKVGNGMRGPQVALLEKQRRPSFLPEDKHE